MGRYYSGDIEGKFWFGVQSSRDPEFFGAVEEQPQDYVYYGFGEEQLPEVLEGLVICRKKLGKKRILLDKFFKENNGYNDEMLVKAGIGNSLSEVKTLLEWYARLKLGQQIYKFLKANGSCNFEAEL